MAQGFLYLFAFLIGPALFGIAVAVVVRIIERRGSIDDSLWSLSLTNHLSLPIEEEGTRSQSLL